jgi:hypothetical protein
MVSYAGYYSSQTFTLTNSEICVELAQMVNPATNAEAFPLRLNKDSNNFLDWYQRNGTLYIRKKLMEQ